MTSNFSWYVIRNCNKKPTNKQDVKNKKLKIKKIWPNIILTLYKGLRHKKMANAQVYLTSDEPVRTIQWILVGPN